VVFSTPMMSVRSPSRSFLPIMSNSKTGRRFIRPRTPYGQALACPERPIPNLAESFQLYPSSFKLYTFFVPSAALIIFSGSSIITGEMKISRPVRTLFRLLFLFAVLLTVAVVSAITTIRLTVHGRQEMLPNLVGLPVAKAQDAISLLGLKLKVEDKLYSTQVPAGGIVSQMPAAGTSMKPLQYVHVLVSLGAPQVTVPDVIGKSLRAARITAVERGLNIGDVAAVYWPQSQPNDVVAQDPAPSATDLQSPAMDFLVSLGDQPPAYLCPSFLGKPLGVARAELQQAGFENLQVTRVQSPGSSSGVILSQQPLAGSRITPDMVFQFQVAE
jgi:eukaryotic-like serine/threonine-protein kinase